jgi:hypothetical protein
MKPPVRRPQFDEVVAALEAIKSDDVSHARVSERIEITIPADMILKDGSSIPIRLRDLSPSGFGCFHFGPVEIGKVEIKLAVNSYHVALKWCVPCANNLYMSGGPILGNSRS